jgi:hypothetical protein
MLGDLAAQIAETDEDAVLELVEQARSAIAAHDRAAARVARGTEERALLSAVPLLALRSR